VVTHFWQLDAIGATALSLGGLDVIDGGAGTDTLKVADAKQGTQLASHSTAQPSRTLKTLKSPPMVALVPLES